MYWASNYWIGNYWQENFWLGEEEDASAVDDSELYVPAYEQDEMLVEALEPSIGEGGHWAQGYWLGNFWKDEHWIGDDDAVVAIDIGDVYAEAPDAGEDLIPSVECEYDYRSRVEVTEEFVQNREGCD